LKTYNVGKIYTEDLERKILNFFLFEVATAFLPSSIRKQILVCIHGHSSIRYTVIPVSSDSYVCDVVSFVFQGGSGSLEYGHRDIGPSAAALRGLE
jgi:hypothetical protein